jgi:hypothetical protein
MNETAKHKGRTKGTLNKKRALVQISLRLAPEVFEFYYMHNPAYTITMREVLTEYVNRHKQDSQLT